jgi:hypothetical protein
MHPEATRNRYMSVFEFNPSQNDMLEIIEEESRMKWEIRQEETAEIRKIGEEKLARGDFSSFSDLMKVYLYEDGAGHAPELKETANELLGLREGDLREALKTWLSQDPSS